MEISCPQTFDIQSVSGFLNVIEHVKNEPSLTINFGDVQYVYPFPTIVLAQALKNLIRTRSEHRKLETIASGMAWNSGAIGYLQHFGFFKHIGFGIGKAVDHSLGGSSYLPLTTIKSSQIMHKGHVMQEEIDIKADRLASVIFPGDKNIGPAIMLSYALREIIRNSFEHGGVDKCIAMGQRWYNGDAEIAIADEGWGVAMSLGRVMKFDSPKDAVQRALLPGISSRSVTGAGDWDNSGFGLYVVSELGRRYGEFSIISSGCLLTADNGLKNISHIQMHGTIVKLKVNTRDADYFPNILKQIVTEGEKISESLEGAVRSASKMSKLPVSKTHNQ